MKDKNYTTTDEITYNMLVQKIEQLQSNWNSLREYCKEYADKDTMSSIIFGVVLDKMNELEGVDNENN